MKLKLLATLMCLGFGSSAFAASNVTLYGQIDMGVVVSKAKHTAATFEEKSGFTGMSRWGIKGTEELGNGYSIGFTLEEGITADNGAVAAGSGAFTRESLLRLKGGFGTLAFGRMGALGFAQSTAILRGWAFGTSWGNSSWDGSSTYGLHFGRLNNAVNYVTPSLGGLTIHAMYSNSISADDSANKWSYNDHYYGIGAKYTANGVDASIIFEVRDNKREVTAAKPHLDPMYHITVGGTYDLKVVKPGLIYQYATQSNLYKQHAFGLGATAPLAGGSLRAGAKFIFRDADKGAFKDLKMSEKKANVWTLGVGYEYPLSKRTNIWSYAGYADGGKGWKDIKGEVKYNGYQLGLGMLHKF